MMHPTPPVLLGKERFIADFGAAVAERTPFAAGKIGFSEQYWLNYPVMLESTPERRRIDAYEVALRHHFERQSGVFPSDPAFAREFVAQYAQQLRALDWIGLFGTALEPRLIQYHELSCRFVASIDMEPDRSIAANEALCYLPHLRGARLLLVAPFADLLCARANQQTFERVWARTGKPWFHPACVAAVEFPYGFDPATRARFATLWDLRDFIAARIDAIDYDVALIAAGGLGIPLAAHVKRSGRVALSLGGHLQVLFGVLGQRWRERRSWRRKYFNEAWIDMPERYRPRGWQQLTDGGAYW